MNSAKTLDIPFARKVLEHLIAHPEEHNQDFFGVQTPCGTRGCIAGTAVMMHPEGELQWCDGIMRDTRGGFDFPEQAQEFLGLSDRDAHDLFYTWGNKSALDKLSSYIAEAEAAQ